MSGSERLFCSRPFRTLHVSGFKEPKGDAYLCCPSWLDTVVGNLQSDGVMDLWNGPEARAVRASVLDGSFSRCHAERCPFLKTSSGPVQRVEDVDDPELLDIIAEGRVVLEHGPRELNCSYDRSCNLSCPTCRHERIMEKRQEPAIQRIQERLEAEALPHADYLYITGSGDAFASPSFNRWLRTMDVSRLPRLKTIHLHTNGLHWTPSMWSRIPEDVRRRITDAEISIDAASAETYAVNRRGGEFSQLMESLDFVRTLRAEGPLRFLKISMVVQANNVHELADFVRLGRWVGADQVYFGQLVNWGTFTPLEFLRRAVHLPRHPRHQELLAALRDPELDDPSVMLGNLSHLRPQAVVDAEAPASFARA